MSAFDLNNPPPNYKFNLSVNREETIEERYVRLGKEVVVFLLAAVFVSVIRGCPEHRA